MRRQLDRLIAALLLLFAAPVIAVLAVLVRRQDGGAAFVRLTRVGRNGRRFTMLKLRSMRVGGAEGRAGGSPITAAGDGRITPLGGVLRRYRLDELPQLLNVLRGDMALIGPRPETPEFVDVTDPIWTEVLHATPGIAGPTQLLVHQWEERELVGDDGGGAYTTLVLPAKLQCDRWYVRSASPSTDALVLLGTVWQIFGGWNSDWLRARLDRRIRGVAWQWPPVYHPGVSAIDGPTATVTQDSSQEPE